MLKSGGSILDANPGSDLDAIQQFMGPIAAIWGVVGTVGVRYSENLPLPRGLCSRHYRF